MSKVGNNKYSLSSWNIGSFCPSNPYYCNSRFGKVESMKRDNVPHKIEKLI